MFSKSWFWSSSRYGNRLSPDKFALSEIDIFALWLTDFTFCQLRQYCFNCISLCFASLLCIVLKDWFLLLYFPWYEAQGLYLVFVFVYPSESNVIRVTRLVTNTLRNLQWLKLKLLRRMYLAKYAHTFDNTWHLRFRLLIIIITADRYSWYNLWLDYSLWSYVLSVDVNGCCAGLFFWEMMVVCCVFSFYAVSTVYW